MSLAAAVASVLAVREGALTLEHVRSEPLDYDAFLPGRTVTRHEGTAVTGDAPMPWSLIEKSTAAPPVATPYLSDNALRELHAYESGLVRDLAPGISAPRLHHIDRGPNGDVSLWLEDVDVDARGVSVSDLVDVARDLGRLAGRWLAQVPVHDWLFRGWIRRHSQPEAVAPALERLRSIPSRGALEARVGWSVSEAVELIERQGRFEFALARLPVTLCHHDAVATNVFRRVRGPNGTVLIDWESVGPGPVGTDLASLLFSSARRGAIPARATAALRDDALAAYAEGIRSEGHAPDDAALALGFDVAVALRWTLLRDVALGIADGTPVFRGSATEESPLEALDELIELSGFLLRAAARAFRAV